MKIFTNIGSWRGIPVAFSKQREVTFGGDGSAEVESQLGESLLKDYPQMLFSKEVPKTIEQEKEGEKYVKVIRELQVSIQERDKIIRDQKQSFEKKTDELVIQAEEWRKKCEEITESDPTIQRVSQEEFDKVVEELEALKAKLEGGEELTITEKLSKEDLEGVKVLISSNMDILKGMAKSLEIPEEEYNGLSKVDLAIMLIDKTVNANTNV